MPLRLPTPIHPTLTRPGILLVLFCAVTCLNFGTRAEDTNSIPATVIPKSIFVSQGDTGRDPFFPNSTRLVKKVSDDSKPAPVREDFSRLLKLTGVTGGVKPIATINNLTFAVGEEQEVRVDTRKIKIRVLDIRDKSVTVSVERQAAPVELKLRDQELKFNE